MENRMDKDRANALIKATETIKKQWLPHISRIADAGNAKSKELSKVLLH